MILEIIGNCYAIYSWLNFDISFQLISKFHSFQLFFFFFRVSVIFIQGDLYECYLIATYLSFYYF